jgi:hypothetical protein
MFGIDDPTAISVMPTPEAAGTPGFWTEGNPGLGQAATYVRASFLNGLQSELLSILTAAGVTPSKTTYNQLLTSLNLLYGGRLLGIRAISATGTNTPTAGTKSCFVQLQAGGGGGGGTNVTGAGQCAAGTGGGAGAYAESYLTSGFSGVTVTIGAGGVGNANTAGSNGAASSFAAVLTCPGGLGGAVGNAQTPPALLGGGGDSGIATGGNLTNQSGPGGSGSFVNGTAAFVSGRGGASHFGPGGGAVGTTFSNGTAAVSKGAGGGGACAPVSTGSAAAGGSGAAGVCIIWDFA